jgi:hypothetical protein
MPGGRGSAGRALTAFLRSRQGPRVFDFLSAQHACASAGRGGGWRTIARARRRSGAASQGCVLVCACRRGCIARFARPRSTPHARRRALTVSALRVTIDWRGAGPCPAMRRLLAQPRLFWPLPVRQGWAALPARPAADRGNPVADARVLRCAAPFGAPIRSYGPFRSQGAAHPRLPGRPCGFWGGRETWPCARRPSAGTGER